MSATIDERVVEMRFDNKQFESNAKESLSTLEKLKQALNLSDSTKSFDNLQRAANGVDISGLGNAVESVKLKFSALEVMAITTLSNITNKAINAGTQLVKSLSVDQVTAGWDKYAQKTASVQTIMAATAKDFTDTGEQMEYVNSQLDKLNWFTDETSYSFLDMVNNIGKFTSNNIPLEKSVTAMQGISTWAAISGANVNEASRAMYNLSQALATGAVKLIDWKSIENANMATAEFKQTVIDTAVGLGTLIDKGDGLYETLSGNEVSVSNFNAALSDAWFTADVLLDTLDSYGGFTDTLYEMMEAMDNESMTTSRALQALEEYKNGTLDVSEYAKECGLSVSELTDYMDRLSDETMALGQRSFRAAQEAKTFREAIDATKDAVSTGWMNTFELIFGNYQEAKVLWTDFANFLYDIFAESGNMRNAILSGWKEAGGRDDLFEGIRAGWEALSSVIGPIKEAWDYIFPPKSEDERVQGLLALTKQFKALMESLKLSDTTAENLKRTFQGVFAVVDIVRQAAGALFNLLLPGVGTLGSLSGGVLSVTAAIGDWLVSIDEAIKENEWLTKAVTKVQEVLKIGTDKAKEFINTIKEWTNSHFKAPNLSFITDFTDTVEFRFTPVKTLFDLIGKAITSVLNVLSKAAPIIGAAASMIGNALATIGSKLAEAFTNDGFNGVLDLFNGGVMAAIGVGIAEFIHNLSKVFKEGSGVLKGIKEMKEAVLDTFGAIQSQIKSKTLMNIATAIALLTAALVVLAMMDSDKLGASLGVISALFIDLFASMAIFEKIMSSSGMKSITKISTSMIALSASILVLASALKTIASVDSDRLLGSLGAVSLLLGEMTIVAIALSKYGGKINTGAIAIVGFAAGIVVLAQAVKTLADLDIDQLTKGLVSVGVLLAELAAFMLAAKFGKIKVTQATGIVILSSALLILQKAVEGFGSMDSRKLINGMVTVGAVLSEIAAFSVMSGYAKHVISSSAAVVILAGALILLEKPMEAFGNMSMEQIGKGLLVMGGALAEIAIALKLMPNNAFTVGLGLLEVSAALVIINTAIQSMAEMTWEEIAKGLITLGLALAELTVAMKLMTGTLSGAAAMMVMSTALLALIPVLKGLGGMEWEEIAKGLIALAGAFTVVGVAGAVLGPLAPAILALSGAMALLGVACAGVGAGILAFAAGLTALSVAGVAAAATVVAMLDVLIVGLLNTIANSGEALGGAIKAIVLTLCDVIISCIPEFVKTVMVVVKEVCAALAANAPDIVHYLLEFIIGVIDALAADMPTVIQSVVNLFMSFFSGIIDALKGIDTTVLLQGVAGIGLISALMLALAALASLAPEAMVGVLAMGAVIAELAIVLAAVGALAQTPGLNWLIGEGGNLLQGVGTAIGKFVGGIVGGFMSGISSQFPQIGKDLSDFMTNVQPFIEGAKKIDASAMDGVSSLAKVIILLTAADILNGLTSWFTGGSSIVEFGEELARFGPHFASYYNSIKGVDGTVVQASANAALALAEMASKLPNQGGVISWFTGENSLSVFADELTEFGPQLKKYSDSVKGLDADVVIASANAALALAEMASKLPNQGGIVSWFTGENSISKFAEELSKFGPVLKSYADSVKGLDPAVVQASANAAKSLAEMANNLPNQGGAVSWFTGDNTLSAFGEELSKFGPYISKYARDVSGLNPEVVVASANAAKALAELANNLPNQGGLISWFTGDNDISKFGASLSSFGKSMNDYYQSIAGINVTVLDGVVNEVKKLVDIAKGIEGLNTSSMAGFGTSLRAMASNGIDGLIQAFTDATSRVTAAVETMMKNASNAVLSGGNTMKAAATSAANDTMTSLQSGITSKQGNVTSAISSLCSALVSSLKSGLPNSTFTTVGQGTITALVNGINAKKATALTTVKNLCTAIIQQFKTSLPSSTFTEIGQSLVTAIINGINAKKATALTTVKNLCTAIVSEFKTNLPSNTFQDIGVSIMTALINGINSKKSDAVSCAKTICREIVSAFKDNLKAEEFRSIGEQVANGLKSGIESKVDDIANAAIKAARAAIKAAKDELDVNSPSRVFFDIGRYISMGLSQGILKNLILVSSAGVELADRAIDPVQMAIQTIRDTIDDGLEDGFTPTITPVLDLSDVENGMKEISSTFSKGLDLSGAYERALTAGAGVEESRRRKDQSSDTRQEGDGSKTVNNWNFTQNNTSPKALSRADIYRQTRNQFAQLKEAVEAL